MNSIDRRHFLAGAGAAAATLALPAGAAPMAGAGLPMSAPVAINAVGLFANDAARVASWYEQTVGLRRMTISGGSIMLGVGGMRLLEIIERPSLTAQSPHHAGLYHTAFLLPRREDLARWVLDASQRRVSVDGVADHLVSEAIYLTDPEGNGVEIYADRSPDRWRWEGDQIEMASLPINFTDLMDTIITGDRTWIGAPAGTVVGHVHLKVGDAAAGGRWWQESLDFDSVRARAGAVFLSTGGYHHHIAVNEWQSAGAGSREPGHVGLAHVELKSRVHASSVTLVDPWGTEIRVEPA